MLEEVKIGKVSAKTEAEFKYLARPVKYYDEIGPTELYVPTLQLPITALLYLQWIFGDFAGTRQMKKRRWSTRRASTASMTSR